ncbi:MAG: hypothetical protein ACLSAP_05250 [Oscillospiraceae bacterium]
MFRRTANTASILLTRRTCFLRRVQRAAQDHGEPPPHVLFILATTEVHKVLPTILSRCQRFDLCGFRPMRLQAG